MSISNLINKLHENGVCLEMRGVKLTVIGKTSHLTAQVLEELGQHKRELREALMAPLTETEIVARCGVGDNPPSAEARKRIRDWARRFKDYIAAVPPSAPAGESSHAPQAVPVELQLDIARAEGWLEQDVVDSQGKTRWSAAGWKRTKVTRGSDSKQRGETSNVEQM